MKRTSLSLRGRGRQLVATATLLILPVAAIAWLSPGLVTASSGNSGATLLAFDIPTAPASPAQAGQAADASASVAEDWDYTGAIESRRRARERAVLRSLYLLGRAQIYQFGGGSAALRALRAAYLADRGALLAFQTANPDTAAPPALYAPTNLTSPFN